MGKKWDFSGWATRANLRCSDGRTIRKGAFKDCDGKTVPLVWNHRHDDPSEVLGHALLKDKNGDMYAYCSFNNTKKGIDAKELVNHGDVVALSIYANQLTQSSKTPPCDVIHGCIREVSLVLAGANPGAFIDNVLTHGELVEDEAEIFNGEDGGLILYHSSKDDDEEEIEIDDEEDEEDEEEVEEPDDEDEDLPKNVKKKKKVKKEEKIDLVHSDLEAELMSKVWGVDHLSHADKDDEGGETVREVFDTLTKEQKNAVYAVIGLALSKGKKSDTNATVRHASDEEGSGGKTIGDIFKTMSEKQKKAAYAVIGVALDNNYEDDDDSEEEEDATMKHNVFDSYDNEPTLSHADAEQIFKDARRLGSLKAAVEEAVEGGVLAHAVTDDEGNTVAYGIADIDYLFPDAKTINNQPEFIKREMGWVDTVMNATHHTPFARVKSMFADITMDEARAKGYTKGNLKSEEVFSLLKRTTDPQTIYKKQKLDRDDILDITDFDVVAWLKGEMRLMLNEEIARAILIGDGRSGASNDKIDEAHIRPVYNDADLYTVKVAVNSTGDPADDAKAFIDSVIRSRKLYKGSGNPTLFTTEDWLTEMLLLEDGIGHKLYKTEAELATTLRVKDIVTVEPMENQTIGITVNNVTTQYPFIGVIVNLKDYNIGTNKGGQTSFFDDFDIDYNQQKYLLETRLSGALIKPYSAMSFYTKTA